MAHKQFVIFVVVVLFALINAKTLRREGDPITFQHVHILFRHGAKFPAAYETYPLDPYVNETWYPDGPGSLTMLGKEQAYEGGIAVRQVYDDFLGKIYTSDVLYGRSTDSDRTRATLECVFAGLWPPDESQQWNKNVLWLPITYDYVSRDYDKLLGFPIDHCQPYADEYNKIIASDEVRNYLKNNSETIKYINENTGLNINATLDLFELYMGLYAELTAGKVLPDWTKKVFPDFLASAAKFEYKIQTGDDFLVRGTGGPLIKKVISDARAKINGTFVPDGRKLFLYSAHEYNIAYVLAALKLYEPHIPAYGSFIAIELHKIDNSYGFQLFYDKRDGKGPQPLTIKGCANLCPIDQFEDLLKDLIPDKDWCEN